MGVNGKIANEKDRPPLKSIKSVEGEVVDKEKKIAKSGKVSACYTVVIVPNQVVCFQMYH